MPPRWLPSLATLVVLALGLLNWTEAADAGLDGGLRFAGDAVFGAINFDDMLSFDRPPAPAAAQPTYPGGSLGELFNRGDLIGGFAAGLLGSGVVGLLFGHGVVGELSGVASALGLLFQLALIAMLARLIWTWWHDDEADALADLSPRQLADAYVRPRYEGLPPLEAGADTDADLAATKNDAVAKTKLPHC